MTEQAVSEFGHGSPRQTATARVMDCCRFQIRLRTQPLTCGTIVAESPPDALRGPQEFEQILPWRSVEQIAEPELR
jgi:hypothetical protein